MKKKSHPSPMQYRIRYLINGSAQDSVQYYNVNHSSEALEFLAHTYRRGHIHGKKLKILEIEEYNRFKDSWEDRTDEAVSHSNIPELRLEKISVDNEIISLQKCQEKKT